MGGTTVSTQEPTGEQQNQRTVHPQEPPRQPLHEEPVDDETVVQDAEALYELFGRTAADVLEAQEGHARLEARWRPRALGAAWGAALGAAVSGFSILADQDVIAAVLAFVTAVLSTFLGTVNPAALAGKHGVAAAGFGTLRRELDELWADAKQVMTVVYVERREHDDQSGIEYDAGYYKRAGGDAKKIAALRKRLKAIRARFEKVQKDAPPMKLRVKWVW